MAYRILVALDGLPASESALSEAERIAAGGAAVHFLHVVPMLPLRVNTTSAEVMAGHDQALSYLAGLRERLPDVRGLDLIRTGDPADAILQVSKEFNIDLVTMGYPGSVAGSVMRRAPLPVLFRQASTPAAHKALRRILVPLDGSEDSLTILATVRNLALRTGAEVVFLHLSDRALAAQPAPVAPRSAGDPSRNLLCLADRLEKSGLAFWQTIAEGEPVAEILQHADTLDADLIALTIPAVGEPQRAAAVLGRTTRSVLLQRPVVHKAVANAWQYQ